MVVVTRGDKQRKTVEVEYDEDGNCAACVLARNKGPVSIEANKGKARTVMPRTSDLGRSPLPKPSAADYAKGVETRRFTMAARAVISKEAGEGPAKLLAEDAWKMNTEVLRELPGDSALVRSQVAELSAQTALAAYYRNEAIKAGLLTDRGMMLMERSMAHGVRSERLAVTSWALAKEAARLNKKGQKPVDYEALALEEAKKGR